MLRFDLLDGGRENLFPIRDSDHGQGKREMLLPVGLIGVLKNIVKPFFQRGTIIAGTRPPTP